MQTALPPKSDMMDNLYGRQIADIVYELCQERGQHFNERVQGYIYNQVWGNSSLILSEKSLITIIALAATQKIEQLKVHLWGMLHQGASYQKLYAILTYMNEQAYLISLSQARIVLNQACQERANILHEEFTPPISFELPALSTRETALIDFVAHLVKGDNAKTQTCLQNALNRSTLTADDARQIMPHVAVYCGFPVEMNGLAVLNQLQPPFPTTSLPPQSAMMAELYGETVAKAVYDRCQAMGQHFNERVQGYIYDQVWRNPSLPLSEKSLITIIALATAKKIEQLKIHFWGMLHQGADYQKLTTILTYMNEQGYLASLEDSLAILTQACHERATILQETFTPPNAFEPAALTARETALVDFVAHLAKGDNEKTQECLQTILNHHDLSIEEAQQVMPHVAVYCGFPVEMNGLAVLNHILHNPATPRATRL